MLYSFGPGKEYWILENVFRPEKQVGNILRQLSESKMQRSWMYLQLVVEVRTRLVIDFVVAEYTSF